MKKLLSALLIIALFLSMSMVATNAANMPETAPTGAIGYLLSETPYETIDKENTRSIGFMGDVDCDGKVSIMDATAIQMALAYLETFDEDQERLACVINLGSKPSILDATEIQLWLASLSNNKFITRTLYLSWTPPIQQISKFEAAAANVRENGVKNEGEKLSYTLSSKTIDPDTTITYYPDSESIVAESIFNTIDNVVIMSLSVEITKDVCTVHIILPGDIPPSTKQTKIEVNALAPYYFNIQDLDLSKVGLSDVEETVYQEMLSEFFKDTDSLLYDNSIFYMLTYVV